MNARHRAMTLLLKKTCAWVTKNYRFRPCYRKPRKSTKSLRFSLLISRGFLVTPLYLKSAYESWHLRPRLDARSTDSATASQSDARVCEEAPLDARPASHRDRLRRKTQTRAGSTLAGR